MLLCECESVSFSASINLALRACSVVEQVDITYHTIGHLGHVSSWHTAMVCSDFFSHLHCLQIPSIHVAPTCKHKQPCHFNSG